MSSCTNPQAQKNTSASFLGFRSPFAWLSSFRKSRKTQTQKQPRWAIIRTYIISSFKKVCELFCVLEQNSKVAENFVKLFFQSLAFYLIGKTGILLGSVMTDYLYCFRRKWTKSQVVGRVSWLNLFCSGFAKRLKVYRLRSSCILFNSLSRGHGVRCMGISRPMAVRQ